MYYGISGPQTDGIRRLQAPISYPVCPTDWCHFFCRLRMCLNMKIEYLLFFLYFLRWAYLKNIYSKNCSNGTCKLKLSLCVLTWAERVVEQWWQYQKDFGVDVCVSVRPSAYLSGCLFLVLRWHKTWFVDINLRKTKRKETKHCKRKLRKRRQRRKNVCFCFGLKSLKQIFK